MKSKISAILAVGLAATIGFAFTASADHHKGKDHEVIEMVMKKGHKAPKGQDTLLKKVLTGKASAAEVKSLHNMYVAMAKTKAPKGSQAEWNKRNQALVAATMKIGKGDKSGIAALKKASNCKACHNPHKPD